MSSIFESMYAEKKKPSIFESMYGTEDNISKEESSVLGGSAIPGITLQSDFLGDEKRPVRMLDLPELRKGGDVDSAPVRELVLPKFRQGEEPGTFERISTGLRDFMEPRAERTAKAQIALEAKEEGKPKEKYIGDAYITAGGLGQFTERMAKDFLGGTLGTVESMAGAAEWLSGGYLGREFGDEVALWRQELMPDEPDFMDELASGLGSSVVYFIPGFGVSRSAELLGKITPRLASWLGTTVNVALEAVSEAGGSYRDVMRKTDGDKEKAENAASKTFWWNIPALVISNKLGLLAEKTPGSGVLREGAISAVLEAGQEGSQEVVSSVAKGEDVNWETVRRSAAIGGIIGGGMSAGGHYTDQYIEKKLSDLKEREFKLPEVGAQKEGKIFSEPLQNEYEVIKNVWFGNKDLEALRATVGAQITQQDIAETAGEKMSKLTGKRKFGNEAKNIDKAIQIYMDTQRDPSHAEKYYNKLTNEQKLTLVRSRNLTEEQRAIGDEILAEYVGLKKLAQREGVIGKSLDNYVARIWDLEKPRQGSEQGRKFGTKTRHAKKRVFDTILEGYAAGYDLKVEGATSNLQIYKEEIHNTIQDIKFVDTLRGMKTIEGDPLLTTKSRKSGYVKIKNPNFKAWVFSGKADVEFITETLTKISEKRTETSMGGKAKSAPVQKLERVVLDALEVRGFTPSEAEAALNRVKNASITGDSQTVIKELERVIIERERVKDFKITPTRGLNFFQDEKGVLLEKKELYAPKEVAQNLNNIFGTSGLLDVKGVKSITKANAMIKSWVLQSSLFHHMAYMRSFYLGGTPFQEAYGKLKSGEGFLPALYELTPDGAYKAGLRSVLELDPGIELLVKNGMTLGKVQDWEEKVWHDQQTFIGKTLDKLKVTKVMKDKILAFRQAQENFLFKEFGMGLKAKAALIELKHVMKKHPNMEPNQAAKIVGELMNADFGGLHLGRIGRSPTTQHIFRLFALAPDWTESNIRSMVSAFGRGEERQIYRAFWARAITKGLFATLAANVMLHGDELPEVYMKAWKDGRLRVLDTNITPIYKLFGGELDSRKYFSPLAHFKDPLKFSINPFKSARYKASPVFSMVYDAMKGSDWADRQFTTFKELMETGATVRPSFTFVRKPSDIETIPSFVLNKIRNTQPVQLQKLFEWWQGETEGFDAIAQSMGIGVTSTYVQSPEDRRKTREIRRAIKRLNK